MQCARQAGKDCSHNMTGHLAQCAARQPTRVLQAVQHALAGDCQQGCCWRMWSLLLLMQEAQQEDSTLASQEQNLERDTGAQDHTAGWQAVPTLAGGG